MRCVPQNQENCKGQIGGLTRSKMAAVSSYFLDINSNDFFLIDNKKAFTLWLNVPKVTVYSFRVIKFIIQYIHLMGYIGNI